MTSPGVYRETTRACPRCATRLVDHPKDRWVCEQCEGVWIGDADLRDLVYALAPDLDLSVTVFQYTTRPTQRPLSCPACSSELRPVRFGGVALDRCDKDGRLWFDRDELQQCLQTIGLRYAEREQVREVRAREHYILEDPRRAQQWRPGPEAEPGDGFVSFVRALFGKTRPPDP